MKYISKIIIFIFLFMFVHININLSFANDTVERLRTFDGFLLCNQYEKALSEPNTNLNSKNIKFYEEAIRLNNVKCYFNPKKMSDNFYNIHSDNLCNRLQKNYPITNIEKNNVLNELRNRGYVCKDRYLKNLSDEMLCQKSQSNKIEDAKYKNELKKREVKFNLDCELIKKKKQIKEIRKTIDEIKISGVEKIDNLKFEKGQEIKNLGPAPFFSKNSWATKRKDILSKYDLLISNATKEMSEQISLHEDLLLFLEDKSKVSNIELDNYIKKTKPRDVNNSKVNNSIISPPLGEMDFKKYSSIWEYNPDLPKKNSSTERPLAKFSDTEVCKKATLKLGGGKIWYTVNENFVGEANYRNLKCGVQGTPNKLLDDNEKEILCFEAWADTSWSRFNIRHVKFAKRYGLNCEEFESNLRAKSSNKNTITTSSKELEQEKQKRIALQRKADQEERKRKDLERKLAALEKKQKEQQSKPKPIVTKKAKSEFPLKPIPINFPSVSVKRDDIAVIIGNANYKKQGKDIPNVNPAYADAEGIKQYFMKAKGVREGNIIYLKDATNAQLLSVFGNDKSHKGKLFNYIKPNKSNVYIYYAGHGAPGKEGDAYLVPTDTDSQTIEFTGYPLSTLYSNLGKLPAKSMTVILEACFSGGSQSGSLISRASPIVIQPKKTFIPSNIKVIAAGSERQMASWEEDSSHSLFTKYFLKAMSGEGDINKDGKVSDTELKDYLSDTMTYYARRYYGRDQKVQIHNGG